jgi:hypothetical protein
VLVFRIELVEEVSGFVCEKIFIIFFEGIGLKIEIWDLDGSRVRTKTGQR